MKNIRFCFSLVPLFLGLCLASQTAPTLTEADYRRAADFQKNMRDKVFELSVTPNWKPDSSGFWFLANTRSGKQFRQLDFTELRVKPLFDQKRLARLLSDSLKMEAKADDLPFTRIRFVDKETVAFNIKGESYELNLNTYVLEKQQPEADGPRFERKSPDGKWIAFSKGYNLFIRSSETGEEIQLSEAGRKNYEYASYYGWGDIMTGEGGDRPEHFYAVWSPDSKKILTQICDLRRAEKMYLLDWSVDSLYRPRLLSYYRGSPGDAALVYYQTVIFDVEKRKEIKPRLEPAPHFNSIDLGWNEDDSKLQGQFMERGYKKIHLIEVDPNSGRIDTLYSEASPTNINFYNFNVHRLPGRPEIFLTSERSGWSQLYELNKTKKTLKPLTKGKYVIKDLVHVDERQELIYFIAAGKEAGRNPYFNHLYRIRFDGSDLQLLTPEDAHHDLELSPGARFFIDNFSTAGRPAASVLRNISDGKIVLEISRADDKDLLSENWKYPEVFKATARDGQTIIYGAIWKPTHFDPTKKYPVIDASYTGPHTNVFPRAFSNALNPTNQALAELGFIVVRVDGLGSAGRSKAFQDWSYGKLGENLGDHVAAIRQLGEKYAWVDTTRVGIFGHSAGGYDAAHALLRFPDFYKVGVASSADHDHRMEKAWWPEMYMGWPVGDHYHEQSNITMAGNLKGKLLITHGGIDENVNPSATFKLSEALVRAGKNFDMLIFPSQRHGYRGVHGHYFTVKRWNYFVEHLLGAQPLWPYDFEETESRRPEVGNGK